MSSVAIQFVILLLSNSLNSVEYGIVAPDCWRRVGRRSILRSRRHAGEHQPGAHAFLLRGPTAGADGQFQDERGHVSEPSGVRNHGPV